MLRRSFCLNVWAAKVVRQIFWYGLKSFLVSEVILISYWLLVVGSHARVIATAAISKTKKKAEKLVRTINQQYLEGVSQTQNILENNLQPNVTPSASVSSGVEVWYWITQRLVSMIYFNWFIPRITFHQKETVPYLTMEEFLDGEFPWQLGDKSKLDLDELENTCLTFLTFFRWVQKNHYLVDTWMLKNRYCEEILVTEMEISKLITCKEKKMKELVSHISKLKRELKDHQNNDWQNGEKISLTFSLVPICKDFYFCPTVFYTG